MIAFETNSETSNNILFAIGPEVAAENQVNIETVISVFGLGVKANITAKSEGLFFNLQGPIFKSKHEFSVEFSARNSNNLRTANFLAIGGGPES